MKKGQKEKKRWSAQNRDCRSLLVPSPRTSDSSKTTEHQKRRRNRSAASQANGGAAAPCRRPSAIVRSCLREEPPALTVFSTPLLMATNLDIIESTRSP